MSVPPDLVHGLRQWVLKAEDDFRATNLLAALVANEGDDAPLVAVCFHAQQCVEKYIKALLTQSGIAVRKTHNLVALWRALPVAQAAAFKDEDLAILTRYAVQQRYPEDYEPVTVEEAATMVRLMTELRAAARALLPPAALKKPAQ